MSLSNLNTVNYTLSLDGLNTIEADSIVLNGEEIDFNKYYTKIETDSSFYNKNQVNDQINTRAEVSRFNAYAPNFNTAAQGMYLQWNRESTGRNYYICNKGLGTGGHSFLIYDICNNQVSRRDLEDFALSSDLSSYVLVNTYNEEQKTISESISKKLDISAFNNEMLNYSTTSEVQSDLSSALVSYYTKNDISSFNYQSGLQVESTIEYELKSYYSKNDISGFHFQTAYDVSSTILNKLSNYYNKSDICGFNFQNYSQVNNLISSALSAYSDPSGNLDLTNFVTQTFLTQELSGYVIQTNLTSNYYNKSDISANFKSITSFNNDMMSYYTKSSIDEKIRPLNDTPYYGNQGYYFSWNDIYGNGNMRIKNAGGIS